MQFRQYFSESSYDVVHYELYQPLVQYVAPFFKKMGFTPNKISILRLSVVIAIAVIMLKRPKNYIWLIIVSLLLFLCGASDDLDGYMARKYDMKTPVGAKLDIIVDFTTFLLMNYVVYKYVGIETYFKLVPIGFVILAYKLKEKERFSTGFKISDTANFFSHIFILYVIAMWIIFLKNRP